MENSYDIDSLAAETLRYLQSTYPLPKPELKWSSKVRQLSIRWVSMAKDWYGYVKHDHNNLVIYLNYSLNYSEELLIDTISHEYRHLMQGSRLYTWYSRRGKVGYWNHPMEIDARCFANQVLSELGY
jgi:hypothetical protein